MITSSPNSYLTTELTLLLQQDLDSELGEPRTENLGSEVCDKRLVLCKHPTRLLLPPGRGEASSYLQRNPSGVCLATGWLCVCLWGAAGCVVLAEVTSR